MEKRRELEEKLQEIQVKELEDRARELAKRAGLPYIDLSTLPIQREALFLIEESEARSSNTALFDKIGKALKIAVLEPENEKVKNLIKKLKQKGFDVKLYIASQKSINRALEFYKEKTETKEVRLGVIKLGEEKISRIEKEIKNIADLRKKIEKIATTELIETLFAGALKINASDIHFEPEEKDIRLRYRIDGVLQDIFKFENKNYPPVLNRLKLMAGLKINIHDAPQDGRLTLRVGSDRTDRADIEVRVSALPGAYGESMVMRLLDPRVIKKNLEELGMRPDLLDRVKKQLKKTTRAILTTGPTGSGKTTTLYAFVNFVNKPGIKIITIEDPIEYHIEGISQTQVEPEKGYNFANGLRSIVRQDPDVILVGEIRDAETAEIAMHASLTGHLVLSTLHTNDAAGTIPRLIDMGLKPQIIAPAMTLAMAQRLIRKLCPECKKKRKISPEELKKVKKAIGLIEKTIEQIGQIKEVYEAGKCDQCNLTGYKDRIGVFEVFLVDDEMEKLILKSPSIAQVRDLAVKKGMVTILQDGYLKVLEGISDFSEIERVLGE